MKQPKHRQRGKESQPEKPQQAHKQPGEQKSERLQKIMATAGLGSRRTLEKRIKDGEVLINNQPATSRSDRQCRRPDQF